MSLWKKFFPARPVFRRDLDALQLAEGVKRQLLLGVPPEQLVAQLCRDLEWSPEQAMDSVAWECRTVKEMAGMEETHREAIRAFLRRVNVPTDPSAGGGPAVEG